MTLEEVKEMQNYGPHTSGCLARTVPALPSHSRQVLTYQNLKGLSHEIDFKNFDKNLQNLALNFFGARLILKRKKVYCG
jgi:hypothetical protein